MPHYCLKVRRKAFNYYADNIARCLDKAAAYSGYHVVLNPAYAEWICLTYVNESKWMIFVSRVFDEVPYERLREVTELIAAVFKAECVIEPMEGLPCGGVRPDIWYFSSRHSAYDEPAFITEGASVIYIMSAHCVPGRIFSVTAQNRGGPSKGIVVNISYRYVEGSDIKLHGLQLVNPDNGPSMWAEPEEHEIKRSIVGNRRIVTLEMPDFSLPDGFNIYSYKLRGKARMLEEHCHSFSLTAVPIGDGRLMAGMEVAIYPQAYPANKAVWRNGLPLNNRFNGRLIAEKSEVL